MRILVGVEEDLVASTSIPGPVRDRFAVVQLPTRDSHWITGGSAIA
jgi:hypothetical protein